MARPATILDQRIGGKTPSGFHSETGANAGWHSKPGAPDGSEYDTGGRRSFANGGRSDAAGFTTGSGSGYDPESTAGGAAVDAHQQAVNRNRSRQLPRNTGAPATMRADGGALGKRLRPFQNEPEPGEGTRLEPDDGEDVNEDDEDMKAGGAVGKRKRAAADARADGGHVIHGGTHTHHHYYLGGDVDPADSNATQGFTAPGNGMTLPSEGGGTDLGYAPVGDKRGGRAAKKAEGRAMGGGLPAARAGLPAQPPVGAPGAPAPAANPVLVRAAMQAALRRKLAGQDGAPVAMAAPAAAAPVPVAPAAAPQRPMRRGGRSVD